MIKVDKTKEPKQWTEHRNTPGADFTTNPHLQMAILRDQGFTCAYCGRRIPCNDRIMGADGYRPDKVRIEHVYPATSSTRRPSAWISPTSWPAVRGASAETTNFIVIYARATA